MAAQRIRVVHQLALAALAFPVANCAAQTAAAEAATPEERVIITARKREELLVEVPVAVSTFSASTISDYNIRSFIDYATRTPNLTFAYGNGGTAGNPGTAFGDARTIAIRGIAGARTTGFYIDDTPLPGAIDVRVADLASIEVLKGPQGTLYGESSLGGNVRLVSRAPDLRKNEWRGRVEAGAGEGSAGLNYGGEAVANIVLAEGRAAMRLVAMSDNAAGYLTRSYPSNINDPASARVVVDNQGAQRHRGVSLNTLLRLDSAWDLALRLAWQDQRTHGFPASYAPLPGFMPLSDSAHTTNVQPGARDTWSLPALTLRYHGRRWSLTSSTSQFQRRVHDVEDSTEGTAAYWGTTLPQSYAWNASSYAWNASHRSRQLAHETRLGFDGGGALKGTLGLFYSKHRAEFGIADIYAQFGTVPGTPALIWRQLDVNIQRDTALFAEFDYRFLERFTLTAGLRRYWLRQDDHLNFAYLATEFDSKNANSTRGVSPKLALSYQASKAAMLYATAGKGFRQGNAQFDPSGFGCDASLAAIGQTPASMTKVAPDAVWNYEVGAKMDLPEPGLLLTAALFRIEWDKIQQPIFLPSCAFYMQGNAGAATIDGAELELAGRLTPALKVRAGLGYTDARITAGGNTGQAVGSPVYQVPRVTASVGAMLGFAVSGAMRGFVVGDASYTGKSLSANSGADLHLTRAAYRLANLRAGLRWDRSELSLGIRNVGNARPNLGDIGYIGYQRYVPGSTTPLPQVVTLPPRTWMLQYSTGF
jgi:iron complex outermembrane recepter protein